ncbi:hypothetical protein [Actinocorallia longicatena]|uniref:type II secretion system F family protein n=1 Tax=Actinocorallia longicatena TaxID=111803 RepID=UPI0031D20B39
MDRASTAPGAESLRLLAASWRIGVERGATFATVIDSLAAALRDETAHQEHITSQLAAPKATAKLLAALPLLGMTMAWAMGANPLAFLFTTLPGLASLTAGTLLNAAGLLWTHRIAQAAQHPT